MVQIIENWSDVTGTVQEQHLSGPVRDHGVITLHVDKVDPVPSFPNLLENVEQQDIEVQIPTERMQESGLKPGTKVLLRLRRGSPTNVFAHPDFLRRLD